MTPGADVRGIDALREWQSALAQYKGEADEALHGIRLEIQRGVAWVEEQQALWQHSIRKREDAVVQARAELSARQFPDVNGRMPDTALQERNLRRAIAALEHAQAQVKVCRRWLTELPKVIDETFAGPGNRLGNLLDGDVTRGLAVLARRVVALEEYAGLRMTAGTIAPPTAPTAPAPSTPTEGSP